jgi:hypothetical protein
VRKNLSWSVAVTQAIDGGDLDALNRLLAEDPRLATASTGGRTLLHVAPDWPGLFPNIASAVTPLMAAGADPKNQEGLRSRR